MRTSPKIGLPRDYATTNFLRWNYNYINRKFFLRIYGVELSRPKAFSFDASHKILAETTAHWGKGAGQTTEVGKVALSSKIQFSRPTCMLWLLHEMAHIYLGNSVDCDKISNRFEKVMKTLIAAGALDGWL